MPDDRSVVREIHWRELFPWTILTEVFGLAVGMQPLVLASLALLLTPLGWWGAGQLHLLATDRADPLVQMEPIEPSAGEENETAVAAELTPAETKARILYAYVDAARRVYGSWELRPTRPADPVARYASTQIPLGPAPPTPIVDSFSYYASPFVGLFQAPDLWSALFFLSGILWTVLIWTVPAAVISRMAVVRLARDEFVDFHDALQFGMSRCASYMAAPLLPVLGAGFFAVLMMLLGLIMSIPYVGPVLGAIMWIFVLLGGLIMALLLLGVAVGWPLMWATISAEGSDMFDAISRTFAYVYHRPLAYLFYVAVATVLGLGAWLLVWAFSETIIYLGRECVDIGYLGNLSSVMAASPGDDAAPTLTITGWIIFVWEYVVRLAANAFSFTYFWTAAAAIYLLLRQDVDQMELDEVYLDDEDDELYGLPPLNERSSGVPSVHHEPEASADSPEPRGENSDDEPASSPSDDSDAPEESGKNPDDRVGS